MVDREDREGVIGWAEPSRSRTNRRLGMSAWTLLISMIGGITPPYEYYSRGMRGPGSATSVLTSTSGPLEDAAVMVTSVAVSVAQA